MKLAPAAALVLLVLLGGCNTLNDRMQSWIGQPRDKLIDVWGPPDREEKRADGATSLLYLQESARGYAAGNASRISGAYSAGACRMVFNLDGAGIVRSCSYYGSCRSANVPTIE